MKQVSGCSMACGRASTKRDVLNELIIFTQAVWGLGLRTLAGCFGGHQECWRGKARSKSQARYQQGAQQSAPVKIDTAKTVNSEKTASEETLPAGTLTEIRSISYLDEQSRDLQQNQQQNLQQGLRQMLPALAGFCRQRWLVLVAPPCLPSVEELTAAGINPARVLLVHSGNRNGFDVLEQTLRSGTCGAVLAWLEKGDASTLDRLRLAAEAGNAWGVLFRTARQGKRARIQAAPQTENTQLKMAIS